MCKKSMVKLKVTELDPAMQLTNSHKKGHRCFVFFVNAKLPTKYSILWEGGYQVLLKACYVKWEHNTRALKTSLRKDLSSGLAIRLIQTSV